MNEAKIQMLKNIACCRTGTINPVDETFTLTWASYVIDTDEDDILAQKLHAEGLVCLCGEGDNRTISLTAEGLELYRELNREELDKLK